MMRSGILVFRQGSCQSRKNLLIIENGGIRGGGQIWPCKQTPMPGLHPTFKTHIFVDEEGQIKGAG